MVSSGYPTMYIGICEGRRAGGYGGKCSPLAGIEAKPSPSRLNTAKGQIISKQICGVLNLPK